MIPGLLLAAGASLRFGSQKLLAPLSSGERLLERALKTHLKSRIYPLVLVVSVELAQTITGDNPLFSISKLTIEQTPDTGYRFACRWGEGRLAVNPNTAEGMSSSLHHGLAALSKEEKDGGVLISLADLPLLTTATVDVLIHEYLKQPVGMLYPESNGTKGHPVIVDARRFKNEISHISGDVGLKNIARQFPQAVKPIPWPDDTVIRDIDTGQDLAALG